jgi:hypothetical protein
MSAHDYPAPVRERIARHLDEIDRSMRAAGAPDAERAAVRADVAAHLDEMLADLPTNGVTLAALEERLARVDSPADFAPRSGAAGAPPTPRNALGALALLVSLLGLALPLAVAGIAAAFGHAISSGAYVAFAAMQVLAISLGAMSRRDPLGRAAVAAGITLFVGSLLLGALFG